VAQTYDVLAICGSLRKASTNRMLLRAAIATAPPELKITEADIVDVPLYNGDIEPSPPASVLKLRDQVLAADALLLVTPEYNHGTSGPMKNAIDWMSRASLGEPPGTGPIIGKTAAMMGASGGISGTMRAQAQLRGNLYSLQVDIMHMPGMFLQNSGSKFNPDGSLNDEPSKKALADFLAAFVKWIERTKRAAQN
jgi:chromate reductase